MLDLGVKMSLDDTILIKITMFQRKKGIVHISNSHPKDWKPCQYKLSQLPHIDMSEDNA